MTFTITITGKGGTGKTLLATLVLRHLLDVYSGSSFLVVDADSNTNLNRALGIAFEKSLGDLREEFIEGDPSLAGSKDLYFETLLYESVLVEADRYDFIAMGRPEGPGCYCYVNHLLRHALDRLSRNYDFVIIDCEAGLEHLSRRTARNVDVMLITVDPSLRSIITAERIKALASELEVLVGDIYVVINRVSKMVLPRILEELVKREFKIIGTIPEDPLVSEYDLQGVPIMNLPGDSPAVQATYEIVRRLVPLIDRSMR